MSDIKSNIRRPVAPTPPARPPLRPAPSAPPARMGAQIQRAANPALVNQAAVRREAHLQQQNNLNRVRPAVRPATPPRTVMPARPAPASVRPAAPRPMVPAARPIPAARPAPGARPAVQPSRLPTPSVAIQPDKSLSKLGSAPTSVTRAAARPVPPRPSGTGMARTAVGGAMAAAAITAATFTLNTASAHPQISSSVSSLQSSLSSLQTQSSFDDLIEELNRLDKDLTHAVDLLESARDKGFVYQKELDDLAMDSLGQWEQIYQQALTQADQQEATFQSRLSPLNGQVSQLNARLSNPTAAAPQLRITESNVNDLLRDVGTLRSNLRSQYSDVQSKVSQLNGRLTTIHWALTQLAEARFQTAAGENLVMAVKARWDQVGDNDPEGLLYLTSKRLIFERKEKVATKKVLFFTTASELVHEVMIDEPVADLRGVKAVNKGLFGHQDFLEVQFPKAGEVALHLDGQDSKGWAALIERVRTGRIEDERSSGSALSFQDLTGELSHADIAAAQNELNELQDELMLQNARVALEGLQNDVSSLERDLADLRARGYAIESDLEGEIAVLVSQWDRVKGNAENTLNTQAGLLSSESKTLNATMAKLAGMSGNLAAARPVYLQFKSAIASAEATALAAENTVLTQFDEYSDEVEGLAAHFAWVGWMLDALATASFQLLATESGVAATEALWTGGTEPENGVLFLTDQRLLWEDRVGEYELKVEVPVQSITGVTKEVAETEEGEVIETLVFTFDGNAPFGETRFELAASVGDDWVKMIGRARKGDYASDRAVEIDPAELERIQNAPTSCSNCAASFTAPVLRGQTEITCEYCGQVTRI